MSKLYKKAIVQKRNILNEIRSNNMTLQELRFFSIYLSKINPQDVSTRVVRFPLSDFQKLMELGTDMNISHFKLTVRRILQQVVEVPNENKSGYRAFQLFKEAIIDKDENDEWYVEFDAHDKSLPLMFDFKNKYFKYELWNALRLKSPNQVRMYEILKQYEGLKKRELSVEELRELLGIAKNEYSGRTGWSDFKKKVLDSCQQALAENTDITYTYERGKAGNGGKWLTIIFYIKENPKFVDKLSLNDFIEQQDSETGINVKNNEGLYKTLIEQLSSVCKNEFTEEELQGLYIQISAFIKDSERVSYLSTKYNELKYRATKNNIPNRYGYIRKLIDIDYKNYLKEDESITEIDSYEAI